MTNGEAEPGLLLGSALPDLASMARFRLLGVTDDDDVTDGIAWHHATDQAFHRHPWFTELQAGLTERLTAAGVRRGPTRAVAHVGPELLLDRWVLETTPDTVHRALAHASEARPRLLSLVAEDQRGDWADHLDRVARWQPQAGDHTADQVTDRLVRILSRRPRLSVAADEIAPIRAALIDVAPRIHDTAPSFMTDIAGELVRHGLD